MINTKFCETVHVGNHSFEIIGDSIDGSTDKVNQDSFGFYHDDECLIVAVADGLGSAPLSQIGSECIVETIIEVLSTQIQEMFGDTSPRNGNLQSKGLWINTIPPVNLSASATEKQQWEA